MYDSVGVTVYFICDFKVLTKFNIVYLFVLLPLLFGMWLALRKPDSFGSVLIVNFSRIF